MGFAITGLAIVNALGSSADEVAAGLQRGRSELGRSSLVQRSILAGRVSVPLAPEDTRTAALLRHAALELAPDLARARKRWGPRRVAVVLGCPRDPTPLLGLAASVTEARGPIYATTTGDLASAHAVVSAQRLLVADLADAVAIGTATEIDPVAFDRDAEPHPLSRTSTGAAPGEGAAWLLLERQGTSDLELVHTVEALDLTADWLVVDATGDPQRDAERLDAHRTRAPLVALAGYWGDLGPAHGLTAVIAAALALEHGFIPASCSYDGHDPRIPTRTLDAECDRVACTSMHGSTRVTLTIGARTS